MKTETRRQKLDKLQINEHIELTRGSAEGCKTLFDGLKPKRFMIRIKDDFYSIVIRLQDAK